MIFSQLFFNLIILLGWLSTFFFFSSSLSQHCKKNCCYAKSSLRKNNLKKLADNYNNGLKYPQCILVNWEAKQSIKRNLHCKKGYSEFPFPSRDVTNQTLPGRESFNYSRPGRVWLVTSWLGTGSV